MIILSKAIDALTRIIKVIAMVVVIAMVPVIAIGVVFRYFGHPIVGIDEIVVMLLLVQIMFSMVYSQSKDRHIKVDLIVDHFPKRVQTIIDIVGCVAMAAFCFVIAYIFVGVAYTDFVDKKTTLLFNFPYFILKAVCAIGFFAWGLESINQIIKRFLGMEITTTAELQKEESA